MLKLLPEETKGRVMSEYHARRLVVILLALIFVLVVTMVGLLPSYVISHSRQNELNQQLFSSLAGVKNTADDMALSDWLKSFNLKLRLLAPKLDTDKPSQILTDILNLRGEGVSVTNLGWSKGGQRDEGETLSLSGIARDRQALLAFESSLEGSHKFSDVSLPVSNLAKDRDISFSIKLVVAKAP